MLDRKALNQTNLPSLRERFGVVKVAERNKRLVAL